MKVFVWERVRRCSTSYHPGGGVVVFAATLDEARDLANGEAGCRIEEDEQPDEIRDCADGPKRVFIMPDAGCC